MQFRDYWSIFSKRWWLIVLVAAAACASSYVFAKVQTPIYRSEVQLTVTPSRVDYNLVLVLGDLLPQYQDQLLSRHIASIVDDKLQQDLPVDTLLSKVKVSAVQNGFLLDMTVDDTDPNRAQSIAQTWADEFIQEHEADMAPLEPTERVTIKELDKPLPGVLYFPKTKQYVLAAGILGLVIGAVLAFLLEYLDDTLKTPDDVERFVSLPLIGSIPMASEVTLPPAKSNGRAKVKLAGGRTSG